MLFFFIFGDGYMKMVGNAPSKQLVKQKMSFVNFNLYTFYTFLAIYSTDFFSL